MAGSGAGGSAVVPPPGLADLLTKLGITGNAEGWAGLDPTSPDNTAAREQQARERFERAKVIADAFTDDKGRRALQALRDQTVELAAWKPDELGLLNAIGFGIYREGQDQLIRFIERCIETAERGPTGEGQPAKPRRKR